MKLALGTAQFGLDYGISNAKGQVTKNNVRAILGEALQQGIDLMDTAAAYGESEQVLGEEPLSQCFNVVTKVPSLHSMDQPGKSLYDFLSQSLQRLQRDQVNSVMLHDANDLLSTRADEVYQALSQLKAKGLVKKIGVSAYYPKQVDDIISRYSIDLVQVPLNIFDQRFVQTGTLLRLKQQGIEIHARSFLLQGLLLMEPEALDSPFDGEVKQKIQKMKDYCSEFNVPTLSLLMRYIASTKYVDYLVVGVTSVTELSEIISSYQALDAMKPNVDFDTFRIDDERLILPIHWSQ